MEKRHHIKDPGSAITHFIGMLMAIFAHFPLQITVFIIIYSPDKLNSNLPG